MMAERVRPTPETLAKARPDAVWQLEMTFIDGKPYLSREHVDAAHEIEEAYRLMTSDVGHSMMNFEGEGRALRSPFVLGHIDARAEQLQRAYDEWIAEIARRQLQGLTEAVLTIVADNLTLDEMERQRGYRPGLGKSILRLGLQIYAEERGWLRREENA